jgi:predicted Rdx family selenoprotein
MQEIAESLGGTLVHPRTGGYHPVQNYQNQLMVLEQQQKKRLPYASEGTNSIRNGIEPRNGL